MDTTNKPGVSSRLLSLDLFSGITIAAMILVNNPGSSHVYPFLEHAAWNGCTLADLVFPFFLFIVGVAMAFSRRIQGETGLSRWTKVARRAGILFGLGLFLNLFPVALADLGHLRWPGVLQRIALCYFFTALIVSSGEPKRQYFWVGFLLAVHWYLLYFLPVPGFGAGDLSLTGNAAGYLDRIVLGSDHLLVKDPLTGRGVFDPEGLLSTLPAIVTTLLGYFTGSRLRQIVAGRGKFGRLFAAGGALALVGTLWSAVLPLNKQLWTGSYALFTAGLAVLGLAACYYVVDVKGRRRGIMPLVALGANALAIFVGSGLLARIVIYLVRLPQAAGKSVALKSCIYQHLFSFWGSARMGSLLYALCNVLFWVVVAGFLYRRKIFVKV